MSDARDMEYSPASDTDTEQKQSQESEALRDPEVADAVKVLPGTGGPDDVGEIVLPESDDADTPDRA
jgi:hypothetical protein